MTDTLTVTKECTGPQESRTGSEGRLLTFVRPLIGFPATGRYVLQGLGDAYAPFVELASLDEEGLGFVVVPPGALFDDYVFEIPEADVALLALNGTSDVEVLALVTRRPGDKPTVNLMGPVVVNRRTREAIQVVLQDGSYGVTVPVDAGSARTAERVGAAL